MKKTILLLITLAATVMFVPACKKKKGCMDMISITYDSEAEEDDGSCQYAGTGGNTTIVARPEHHGTPIGGMTGYPDSVFVKFNTQESPGSSAVNYDLVVVGEEGEDHVHVTGLKPGKYYIMATGFDSTANERVFGGIPYVLTKLSGEVDVVIPVTE